MQRKKGTGHWIYSDYQWIKFIDAEDKKGQMFIHKTMNVTPFHYFSVIKMNSTYLELCNRPYQYYGLMSLIFIIMFGLSALVFPLHVIYLVVLRFIEYGDIADAFISLFLTSIILVPLICNRL